MATIPGWLNSGWCAEKKTLEGEEPSLSQIVFFGSLPASAVAPERYQGRAQECIRRYLASIPPGSYLCQFELPSSAEKVAVFRRRVLVEHMVAILGGEVRTEAEAFAQAFPLVAEWEGRSEGPVQEADFIDRWLRGHPGTSTAPFLHLLKAHRFRAGYEAARARQESELWPILERRYREALGTARRYPIPLLSCIADDLEAQPYIYLEGQGRP